MKRAEFIFLALALFFCLAGGYLGNDGSAMQVPLTTGNVSVVQVDNETYEIVVDGKAMVEIEREKIPIAWDEKGYVTAVEERAVSALILMGSKDTGHLLESVQCMMAGGKTSVAAHPFENAEWVHVANKRGISVQLADGESVNSARVEDVQGSVHVTLLN